ncbi:MAG TPA: CocE/NonD family hydrolase [Candidatus Dormibacteraeota bacterium]|nr:CocE/NonD family hydrolase [Candidatus Dormibacteraeota bacterium]
MQSITAEFDVPGEMSDGTVLRANVFRPSGASDLPVLLTRLPYGKDLPLGSSILDPIIASRRGYMVVIQDTRGRFTSEGDWYPMRAEREDGRDTVDWASRLPGADGGVGMYGGSYFGFTQWAAARDRPPALKAMVPTVTWADPQNGVVYRDGAFELGLQAQWNLTMGGDVLLRRYREDPAQLAATFGALIHDFDGLGEGGYASLPLRDFPPLGRHGVSPAFFDGLRNPMEATNPMAEVATVAGWRSQVTVPTFNIGGWYDIFSADTIANFRAMRAAGRPSRLLMGPWSHGGMANPIGQRNFGFASQAMLIDLRSDLMSMQLRWFDHWLRGIDTGMLAEPPVQIFVMGRNRWRFEDDWPLERAETVPHYLHQGGRLGTTEPGQELPDGYEYDPANPVTTLGGATLMTSEYRSGAYDQREVEARTDVLTFTSEELEHDLEVTGPIEVHLWASSSAPDTDFVARLSDVFPDGRSFNLTDGIIRARFRDHRKGMSPSLIEPDRPYEYVIDLWATSNVFLAGHRIRVAVTSSSFPRWDRNPNTGHDFGADAELSVARQRILHDREHPSHVLLPVVPS